MIYQFESSEDISRYAAILRILRPEDAIAKVTLSNSHRRLPKFQRVDAMLAKNMVFVSPTTDENQFCPASQEFSFEFSRQGPVDP